MRGPTVQLLRAKLQQKGDRHLANTILRPTGEDRSEPVPFLLDAPCRPLTLPLRSTADSVVNVQQEREYS